MQPEVWALSPSAFFTAAVGAPPDAWQAAVLRSSAPQLLLNCCRQSREKHDRGGRGAAYGVVCTRLARRGVGAEPAPVVVSVRSHPGAVQRRRPAGRASRRETLSELVLANGSRLHAVPGDERTIRGLSAIDLALVDEAARAADTLFEAVRPMLATRNGRIVLLSTPYAKQGVFFNAWTGATEWERVLITAGDVSRISAQFLERERAELGPMVYRREYLGEFGELEDAAFHFADLDRLFIDDMEPLFSEPLRGGDVAAWQPPPLEIAI